MSKWIEGIEYRLDASYPFEVWNPVETGEQVVSVTMDSRPVQIVTSNFSSEEDPVITISDNSPSVTFRNHGPVIT